MANKKHHHPFILCERKKDKFTLQGREKLLLPVLWQRSLTACSLLSPDIIFYDHYHHHVYHLSNITTNLKYAYISYLQLMVERGAEVLVDMRIIVPGNLLFEICHLSSFIIDRQS